MCNANDNAPRCRQRFRGIGFIHLLLGQQANREYDQVPLSERSRWPLDLT